jgi:uncharacterized protein YbgA (DUF1722 family)/uncharacterized protein YbbK (DUF523 family)
VEWVHVCPEVELGLGIPREAIRLVDTGDGIRLLGTRSATDHTRAMQAYAAGRIAALRQEDLCGYVLKKSSPSCGMERVKVYGRQNMPSNRGQGIFAAALMHALPLLPVEEEGRLSDPRLRDNFVERVFAYRRLRSLFAGRWTLGQLVRFHTAHKLQLLAHSPAHYHSLGRLVARGKAVARAALRERYEVGFMTALRGLATPRRHVNVLEHMTGYFRDRLEPAARSELRGLIDDYGKGLVPLIVPMTLVRHYVRELQVEYLTTQVYLEPHPKELMLRNHV